MPPRSSEAMNASGRRRNSELSSRAPPPPAPRQSSYMDADGNLCGAPRQADDFGKGFRNWAAASGSSEGDSFLSRGKIMKFLKKKKEGKIGGMMHRQNNKKSSSESKLLKDSATTRTSSARLKRSNTAPARTTKVEEHSTSTHRDDFTERSLEQPPSPPKPTKQKAYKTQRKNPNTDKYARKDYKIGMEPHLAADGIMRTRAL